MLGAFIAETGVDGVMALPNLPKGVPLVRLNDAGMAGVTVGQQQHPYTELREAKGLLFRAGTDEHCRDCFPRPLPSGGFGECPLIQFAGWRR